MAVKSQAGPSEIGLVEREQNPENLESPRRIFDGFLTPPGLFSVRNHFEMPEIDVRDWRLSIEGKVRRPCEFDFSALRSLPTRSVTATLECAGNSRMLLAEKVKGVQWELGAVGTAEWTGVPLPDLLERAGIEPDATEVILEGTDHGRIDTEPKMDAEVPFARSLPLSKTPEVLLACAMNARKFRRATAFPFAPLFRAGTGWLP